MKKQLGFSMLEIIIVIGLLMIITTGTTVLFLSTISNNQREVVVNEIVSSLREAQSRAMNGENQSEFGIYFDQHKYIEFQGDSYSDEDINNNTNLLPAGVTLQSIDFNGNSFVFFERMTGEANNAGTVDIKVTGRGGVKRIIVNKQGIVNLENVN